MKLVKPRPAADMRTVYDFKRADFDRFRELLSASPWDTCLWGPSIEDSWQSFKDLLLAAVDECIPKVIL